MRDSIVTKGRLTVMMPIVKKDESLSEALVRIGHPDAVHKVGRQLVHEILVRKGMTYLMDKSGTRLKPVARMIFNSNMQRLASNEPPESIVRDLESQLLLIKGN